MYKILKKEPEIETIDYENMLITEDSGMCAGETHYTLEEIYQAFKERLVRELKETCPIRVKDGE